MPLSSRSAALTASCALNFFWDTCANISGIRRVLLCNRREDAVLAHRLVLVLRDELSDLLERDRSREAGEVVELRRDESIPVVDLEVGEELLRGCLVLRELPDPPAAHHMLLALPAVRASRDGPDPEVVRKGQAPIFRRARG